MSDSACPRLATAISILDGILDASASAPTATAAPAQCARQLRAGAPHAATLSGGAAGGQDAAAVSDGPAPLRTELRQVFANAITAAFPQSQATVALVPCTNPKFGDYQCNNAMALFKELKQQPNAPKNPRAVAQAIVDAVGQAPAAMVAETSLAGAGFINIKVDRQWLAAHVLGMVRNGASSVVPRLSQRVVVDFSSPNVAKEMHVGHLRSTIIGDTICKALELRGADVVRLNHIGDWGTQFGMLIQFMREREGGFGEEEEGVSDLMALYRASKQRFDADEGFKDRAREAVTKLQGGDAESLAAWGRICETSRREFEALYRRLGVTITERGESFYNPFLPSVVEDLRDKGVLEESDGAKVVWVDADREAVPPLIVQKRDGGFGYASTDMAAIQHRIFTEKADWIVYVTDVGQASHFDAVFKAARLAGWIEQVPDAGEKPRVDHVGFGLVLGEDGKRFRTRSSEVVRLVDLLDEARDRCLATIKERRAERSDEAADEAEMQAAACAMGYGAVKYADLKNSRLTDYKFSFDAMLALKGNTAVYLLYAHARIAGIVRNSGVDVDELAKNAAIQLVHDNEIALALHLAKFPEAVEDMLEDLLPNKITDYLYTLSEVFNSFYTECKVLGTPEQDSRLLLVEAAARVMRECFQLLGITPLYRI